MAALEEASTDQGEPPRASLNALVAGDWVVDEHWVVGVHRTTSSSRTGRHHTRALHLPGSSIRSLCGAGQVASILHQANPQLSIWAVGIWSERDTTQLAGMLDPAFANGQTHHRLMWDLDRRAVAAARRFINLARGVPDGQTVSTNLMIRIHEQTGHRIDLTERIDWELPLSDDHRRAIKVGLDARLDDLPKDEIRHVVIKDLGKGTVTPELIEALKFRCPFATWYISSKQWRPDWYENLPRKDVGLLLIPQLAAKAAVANGQIPSWITPAGHASLEALTLVQELANEFPEARIVVLPREMCILARNSQSHSAASNGALYHDDSNSALCDRVPMASVFFPYLVSLLSESEGGNAREPEFHQLLGAAIARTTQWMKFEAKRFEFPEEWVPRVIPPAAGAHNAVDIAREGTLFDWEVATKEWTLALSGIGVVRFSVDPSTASVALDRPRHQFQLWRAMSEVDGYICCVTKKRTVLRKLIERAQRFKEEVEADRRHVSFMLIDDPGSGKSYLVKRLAKAVNMRVLEFNITQMLSRSDLIHCFDTIVTTQAQDPDDPLLIFVDEINAKLHGEHVYDAFLAPLEDGIYIRSGNRFHIQPCMWIFAGTEAPMSGADNVPHDRSDKGSDFASRLTDQPLSLKLDWEHASKSERACATIEKVYLGVTSILQSFPDVRHVSEKVLMAFSILPRDASPRAISRFAKSIQSVQYSRVTAANLPPNWYRYFGDDDALNRWWLSIKNDLKPDELVDIQIHPSVGNTDAGLTLHRSQQ